MTEILDRAWELMEAGDAPATLRHLREHLRSLEFTDLGQVVERLAETAGFDDLRSAAAALAADPERPQARFDFGYACIERGISFVAVPVLAALLRQVPDEPTVYRELVAALEDESRHAEAVAVLREREPAVSADVSARLVQVTTPPWGEQGSASWPSCGPTRCSPPPPSEVTPPTAPRRGI